MDYKDQRVKTARDTQGHVTDLQRNIIRDVICFQVGPSRNRKNCLQREETLSRTRFVEGGTGCGHTHPHGACSWYCKVGAEVEIEIMDSV